MAQPITELPLFRLHFLPAICYLFYWFRADWTPSSSRTIMRHESGSLRETPVTRGLHPTNHDSFHTHSGRWLTSNSARRVAQTPIVPHSLRIPASERKQARGVVGQRTASCWESGDPRCRLNLRRVFVVFLSFARPVMEIKWGGGPFVLYYPNRL
jgi:hypothetical protein